jgi:ATP-dependent Clp protease, protease subunit
MTAGMVAAYRDKSGRDDAEIEGLMAAETWLSAHEAVDLGLADRVEAPVRMAAHFDLSRFRNAPLQLAALAATPTSQEDDMSDSKKASPRKPGPDESSTPQVAPPGTSADDTATGPASQPAAVAEPAPALGSAATPQPAVVGSAHRAEPPPQATAQVIDLDAVRADERRATLAYVAEVHELCALACRGDLAASLLAKATPIAQVRRALLEARAAEDEATAIRGQARSPTVEPAQPAIDTAAIYAARNQNVR